MHLGCQELMCIITALSEGSVLWVCDRRAWECRGNVHGPLGSAQKTMSRWDTARVPFGHPGHHFRPKAKGWAVLLMVRVADKFQEADNTLQTMLVFTKIDY